MVFRVALMLVVIMYLRNRSAKIKWMQKCAAKLLHVILGKLSFLHQSKQIYRTF